MAATAAQVVKQILNEINVRGSESDLAADEVQDTIFNMNAYMAHLASKGIDLGYTEVENLGDPVTVPAGAMLGLIANVAVMMCPTFGQQPSAALITKARQGLDAMRLLGVTIVASEYGSTLPVGSGNETWQGNEHFYADSPDKLAKEQGGSIILESGTNG